jgi:hypothetical protein
MACKQAALWVALKPCDEVLLRVRNVQMLDERRLVLTLNSKGEILTASPSPESLFGFQPQELVSITDFVWHSR